MHTADMTIAVLKIAFVAWPILLISWLLLRRWLLERQNARFQQCLATNRSAPDRKEGHFIGALWAVHDILVRLLILPFLAVFLSLLFSTEANQPGTLLIPSGMLILVCMTPGIVTLLYEAYRDWGKYRTYRAS